MFFLNENVLSEQESVLSISEAYLALAETTYTLSVAKCELLSEDYRISLGAGGLSEEASNGDDTLPIVKNDGILSRIKAQLKLWFKALIANIKAVWGLLKSVLEKLFRNLKGETLGAPASVLEFLGDLRALAGNPIEKLTRTHSMRKVSKSEFAEHLVELMEYNIMRTRENAVYSKDNPHMYVQMPINLNFIKTTTDAVSSTYAIAAQSLMNEAGAATSPEEAVENQKAATSLLKISKLITSSVAEFVSYIKVGRVGTFRLP